MIESSGPLSEVTSHESESGSASEPKPRTFFKFGHGPVTVAGGIISGVPRRDDS